MVEYCVAKFDSYVPNGYFFVIVKRERK